MRRLELIASALELSESPPLFCHHRLGCALDEPGVAELVVATRQLFIVLRKLCLQPLRLRRNVDLTG